MHDPIQEFYKEYEIYLNATKEGISKLKAKYQEVAEQIHDVANRKALLSELFTAKQHCFQMNYFLMESHMRFHNYFVEYNEEQMAKINQYKRVFKEASDLCLDVHYYLESFNRNKTNDDGVSI